MLSDMRTLLLTLSLVVGLSSPAAADVFGFGAPRPAEVEHIKGTSGARFYRLPDEPAHRSFSVGTVTEGWVVDGAVLPLPGRTYSVLPRQYRRELLYGTRELIALLVDASEYVERVSPGSIMWLGNIGHRDGGDIPWSVSHNAGRDADIAFYALSPRGVPLEPPDMLHYDARGRSLEYGGYYRFDVARNWALVKALLLSPHAQIQHLFISTGLERLLIDHAREEGEPLALINHAARVLRQPGPEIPHNDHLHVRVYCSRADMGAGCRNTGRVHPGVSLHGEARAGRLAQAERMASAGSESTRRAAVQRVGMLGGDVGALRAALTDRSQAVRLVAVDALAARGDADAARALISHWDDEEDARVRLAMLRAGGVLGGAEVGLWLEGVLREPLPVGVYGRRFDARLVACDAVAASGRAEPVYRLTALLDSEDAELRARAASALRVVANRALSDVDWRARGVDESTWASERARWRGWVDEHAHEDRDTWLHAGFADAGYTTGGGAASAAASLASAAGDGRAWLRTNAQRELIRWTDNPARSLEWSPRDARIYWTRWVRRNPGRIRRPR